MDKSGSNDMAALFTGLIAILLIVVGMIILMSGCCWLSKRSCFPECDPPTKVVVEVEKPCQLPPTLTLEPIKRLTEGCPDKAVCFSILESGKLASQLAELKGWIREVRKRCGGPPTSQPTPPTSQPIPPTSDEGEEE